MSFSRDAGVDARRTVKYEDVYLKGYETPKEVYRGLRDYFTFYNEERPHLALACKTPAAVYRQQSGC